MTIHSYGSDAQVRQGVPESEPLVDAYKIDDITVGMAAKTMKRLSVRIDGKRGRPVLVSGQRAVTDEVFAGTPEPDNLGNYIDYIRFIPVELCVHFLPPRSLRIVGRSILFALSFSIIGPDEPGDFALRDPDCPFSHSHDMQSA